MISYRFPLKDLNNLVITFYKKPIAEDWQEIRNWLELWGDNLCEHAFQQSSGVDRATGGDDEFNFRHSAECTCFVCRKRNPPGNSL